MIYRSTSVCFVPLADLLQRRAGQTVNRKQARSKVATSAPSSAAGFMRRTLSSNLDPTATLFNLKIGRDALVTARCTAAEGGFACDRQFLLHGRCTSPERDT